MLWASAVEHGFAREELVADLGSAFLCADLELAPPICPSQTALKKDKLPIFQVTSHAQRAIYFLHGPQQRGAGAAA